MKSYFEVFYVDDFNVTHMTIVRSSAELQVIKDRFDNVEYTFHNVSQN